MAIKTVTTWTCDGCGASLESTATYPPRSDWLQATFRRQKTDTSQELHFMLLCVACQERMLKALKRVK